MYGTLSVNTSQRDHISAESKLEALCGKDGKEAQCRRHDCVGVIAGIGRLSRPFYDRYDRLSDRYDR